METKTDASFGVIPYTYINDTLHFLVIYQTSYMRGDRYWVFPKGHPEAGEAPEETAARELTEETGLTLTTLHTAQPLTSAYEFVHEGILIQKTVTFFLGEVTDRTLALDGHEVTDAIWLPYEAALEKLSHDASKNILSKVRDILGE